MESDNESGNVCEIGSVKHKESLFTAKLTHESELDSRLFETSFSLGNVIYLILDTITSTKFTQLLQIEWSKNEWKKRLMR